MKKESRRMKKEKKLGENRWSSEARTELAQVLVSRDRGRVFEKMLKGKIALVSATLSLLLAGCWHKAEIISIDARPLPVTSALDACPDEKTSEIVDEYQQRVREVQAPVLGTSAVLMDKDRPEGLLSNFAADAIRWKADALNGGPVDFAVTNMGGLRNVFPEGDITVGHVFNVFPFDNYLFLMTLTGAQCITLFEELANAGGQCISGANLVITSDGKLIDAKIGGKPIDKTASYRIATIDYLAEGNDGMTVLSEGTERTPYEEMVLRQVATDYIKTFTDAGLPVTAAIEGRIIIKD